MPSLAALLSPESLSAAGRGAEKLSLPALQSKMKCDPEGYEAELLLLYRHFESSLHLFRHESALMPTSDLAVAKELGDLTMFLAHVTPFYPERLAGFPRQVVELLRTDAQSLPSSLRCHLAQALILLINRNTLDMDETLELFMDLQTLGDRTLKKLAFLHVVHSIRRMNQKHKNEANNRKLQNILFTLLQGEEELRAKRSLVILCDLHRRRVWFDDRTANAICNACFHSSSKILVAALSFLLGYEKIEDDDSEASSSDDEAASQQTQIVLSREAVYKAHNKGTAASKKKKKAKLQRVVRNMKRQQRIASQNNSSNYYSPLTHLKDAQGFAEKLFSRLQKCNERFEVRMMMLKLIARAVGLHRLMLLNFYPYMQKYAQPHQRNVTELLAAAVQACHDMVPPDAVEPLFRQIVNQFVHDRSRPEAIAVGLNVLREICVRMPLLMNEDLLQDLVLYKKSHEKAVSTAARSLMTLFREICPSLLVKKDRGRPVDPKARPKAYGEVSINTNVPGIELLQEDEESLSESEEDDAFASGSEGVPTPYDDSDSEASEEDGDSSEGDVEEEETSESDGGEDKEAQEESSESDGSIDESDDNNDDTDIDADENLDSDSDDDKEEENPESRKRKLVDFVGELDTANSSLRALKKLAGSTMTQQSSDEILSNDDFRRIKELKTKKEAKLVMGQHGLMKKGSNSNNTSYKIPSSEELTMKRVDPSKLEINIKRKLSKEQRLQMVKDGREDRGKYQARTAVKQKKTGGLSNREKEHKKLMPIAAKRAKARSRQEKKRQHKRSRKQFLGKKAWK